MLLVVTTEKLDLLFSQGDGKNLLLKRKVKIMKKLKKKDSIHTLLKN